MDTSKEYINQCIKAWPDIGMLPMNGCPNQFIDEDYKDWLYEFTLGGDEINSSIIGQLYRQDQLQDIAELPIYKFHIEYFDGSFYLDYEKNCKVVEGGPLFSMKSMEQLWLAFVMHKRWGKKWDGDEWIPTT